MRRYKMNVDNTIAGAAFAIGLYETFNRFQKSRGEEYINNITLESILISLLGTVLWLIYQYRSYGVNFTVAYTGIALILNLFILNKILNKDPMTVR